jgi:methionine synthase I (cobalamin-dependent)
MQCDYDTTTGSTRNIFVGGSLSTHPPALEVGSSVSTNAKYPPEPKESENYLEAALALASSGVDFIMLEMMKNMDHAPRAIRAAAQTKLPIFLGLSTRLDVEDGNIYLWGPGVGRDWLFTKEVFDSFIREGGGNVVLVNVMHTNFSAMLPTLKLIRSFGYSGYLGAYPDHGHFTSPHWVFEDVKIDVALNYISRWIEECSISLIGGCCGLGPDYITAVADSIKSRRI